MEPLKLPGRDTRLIIHNGTVYKIKLIYVTRKQQRVNANVSWDPSLIQHEVEEAIRVVLLGTLTPLKTDHFIITTEWHKWKLPSLVSFMMNDKQMKCHSSMLTMFVQPKDEFTHQPIVLQQQQAQSASVITNQKVPSNNKDHTSHQVSPVISRVNRKHTRSVIVKEKSLHSPPLPKRARSAEKRSTVENSSPSTHREYILRRRRVMTGIPSAKDEKQTTGRYYLRSEEKTSSSAKSHREKLKPRRTKQDVRDASAEVRTKSTNRLGIQANKGTSQVHEDEPMVGATATAESLPAYPQGGVVANDRLAQQLGQFDEEQYQLNEQMRLQRLAGNQETHNEPQPDAHYHLRPRTLKQMVNAVLTPVRNLFS